MLLIQSNKPGVSIPSSRQLDLSGAGLARWLKVGAKFRELN